MMRKKWKLWLLALVLVLALGGFIINRIQGQTGAESVNAGVQAVTTAAVKNEIRQDLLEVTGTVDAVEKTLVTARIAGVVEGLPVDNGARVQAGQLLAQIDAQPYQSLVTVNEAALSKAQTQLRNTRASYERLRQLHEAGAVSEQDFDNIQAALEVAEADVAAAAAALSNAERDLGNARVSSPIGGLIANRAVVRGQMVSQGMPLMEVHDLSQVYVVVFIGQNELGRIKPGTPAEVTVDAFADRIFKGSLISVNPAVNPQARVFQCKIKADNPDGLLRAGMFARVRIQTGEPETVLSVPEEVLTSRQEQFYVFVPQGDVAQMVPVEIGEVFAGRVEIRQGLTEGQVVINSNINKLKAGDRIQIVTEQGV